MTRYLTPEGLNELAQYSALEPIPRANALHAVLLEGFVQVRWLATEAHTIAWYLVEHTDLTPYELADAIVDGDFRVVHLDDLVAAIKEQPCGLSIYTFDRTAVVYKEL